MPNCKFCQKEIFWVKDGRKNVCLENDGAIHRCEEMQRTMKSVKQIEKDSLSEDLVKQYESAINEKANKKK